jgi:hypothetical protein
MSMSQMQRPKSMRHLYCSVQSFSRVTFIIPALLSGQNDMGELDLN